MATGFSFFVSCFGTRKEGFDTLLTGRDQREVFEYVNREITLKLSSSKESLTYQS